MDPVPSSAPTRPASATTGAAAAAFAIAAVAFVAYLATLYPDVCGGDAGELIAAVATGGVIHPPGYPLYALLGRLVALVPLGPIAFRLNVLSAACDAAAAGVLCLGVARRLRSPGAGLAAGSLFAFAPGIWQYAIGAEVFALENLFVALLLLAALRCEESADLRDALAAALLLGLGLADHQTLLFSALPLAAWLLWTHRGTLLRPRALLLLAACLAAGLLPYAEVAAAGRRAALVSWGATSTFAGFLTHVTRHEYGTFRLSVLGSRVSATALAGAFCRDLYAQIVGAGLSLLAVGIVAAVREAWRRRASLAPAVLAAPVFAVAVFAALGNLPVSDPLHRGIVARFWQQPELFACAFAAAGLAVVAGAAARALGRPRAGELACTLLAAVPLLLHARAASRAESRVVRRYGVELLRPMPPRALALSEGDLITNTMRYLQVVEGRRPDVRVVDQELLAFPWQVPRLRALYPDVTFPGTRLGAGAPGAPGTAEEDGPFSIRALVDANAASHPIVFCGNVAGGEAAIAGWALWPRGLCQSAVPAAAPVDLDRWIAASEAALPRIDLTGRAHPPGSWEDVAYHDVFAARQLRALQLLAVAGRDPARRPYIARAAAILQGIADDDPDAPAPLWRSLAIALGRLGLDTPEERARTAEAWRRYLLLAPPTDPGLDAIRAEYRRLSGQSGP